MPDQPPSENNGQNLNKNYQKYMEFMRKNQPDFEMKYFRQNPQKPQNFQQRITMMDTDKYRKQNVDSASFYDNFEGKSLYEINQIDNPDASWIDEEYLEKNVANPSWVNFLHEFIDLQIVQNQETGEIFAVKSLSEGQTPLKWGELKTNMGPNGEEIIRKVT